MEIYAIVLVVIVGLCWVAWRIAKGAGYKEAELDAHKATIKNNKKAVKDAKDIATMSRAAKRNELSK